MRAICRIIAAATLVATAATAFTVPADARVRHRHHYYGKTSYRHCRYSNGTTGLVAGGVGGAVVGSKVIGGPAGAVAGAVGGAVAGRAVDRASTAPRRCR